MTERQRTVCAMCGDEAQLYTAPGGAMVCEQCQHLAHTINLSRLQGVSDKVLRDAWRETALAALVEAEGHVVEDCDADDCVCTCLNCAPSGSQYCRAAWSSW